MSSNQAAQVNQHHFVVVTFTTTQENQQQALADIGEYVERFLSRQPGFINSRLLAGNDGTGIVHQAEWTTESAFTAIGPLARQQPDFAKLMAYQPKGVGYRLAREFQQ